MMTELSPLLISLAAHLRNSAANLQDTAVVLEKIAGLSPALPVEPVPVVPDPIWKSLTQSRISIPTTIEVPAGQREIYIPVTVDHTARESFYCYVERLVNISSGGINVGNSNQQRANFEGLNTLYRWSPGDDLTHYVKIVCKTAYTAGKSLQVAIRVKGLGDGQKGKGVNVVFTEGAQHPDMPEQFHRPLRRLNLQGATRKNRFDAATMGHSDTGFDAAGKPTWRSRLSHGYMQDGNQETGLYMNKDRFPDTAQNPISYDASEKAVRLHTLAFPTAARPEFDGRLFRHQAAVIQGQTLDEVCGVQGVWRMVAKSSRRRYAWPAFWLIGRGAKGADGGASQWPPEIDVFEHFNHAWGASEAITGFNTTFAQHYGNAGSNNRVGSFGSTIEVDQWMGATGVAEDYHSYACAVIYDPTDTAKSEVTFFFDDVEVGCQILHARHQDMKSRVEFYPIANVAVKAPASYTPESYNTDEGRGHSGDMLIRDIGYYPNGFTFT